MKKPFLVNLSAIRGHFGGRQELTKSAVLDEMRVSGSAVPDGAEVGFDGVLETIEGNNIAAIGEVTGAWEGACRRCLGPASGPIKVAVREIYSNDPVEGETYPLVGDTIDLEPLVRETVMLELPEAPLCQDDCKGLCPNCGVNWNEATCSCEETSSDPRWAALDALKLDES